MGGSLMGSGATLSMGETQFIGQGQAGTTVLGSTTTGTLSTVPEYTVSSPTYTVGTPTVVGGVYGAPVAGVYGAVGAVGPNGGRVVGVRTVGAYPVGGVAYGGGGYYPPPPPFYPPPPPPPPFHPPPAGAYPGYPGYTPGFPAGGGFPGPYCDNTISCPSGSTCDFEFYRCRSS